MTTVFLDGDGTLWDFRKVMREALAATIGHLRELRPDLRGDFSTEAFIRDRDRVAARHTARLPHEQTRHLAFTASLARLGSSDPHLAEELTGYFLERRFAHVALYPDTLACLADLRRSGFRTGLLSNGNTYPDRHGLTDLFDAVVFAHEVGVDKPDPRAFRAAETALPGGDYVMVGDDLTDDVAGAQAVGWRGIWLDRDGRTTPVGVEPDATLTALTDLAEQIRALG